MAAHDLYHQLGYSFKKRINQNFHLVIAIAM